MLYLCGVDDEVAWPNDGRVRGEAEKENRRKVRHVAAC